MNIPWEMIFEMIEKLIAMCFDDEASFVEAARSPTRRQQRIVARGAEAEVLNQGCTESTRRAAVLERKRVRDP
jgi:hypothetical protein